MQHELLGRLYRSVAGIGPDVLLRFGLGTLLLPAFAASFVGAWVLVWLAGIAPVFSYSAFGHPVSVTPVKLVIGLLLLLFASLELLPQFSKLSFAAKYMLFMVALGLVTGLL